MQTAKEMKASENSSSSDDSSSSDEEESARLKEVVEESLGSMKGAKSFKEQDKPNSNAQKQHKPSLRNVSQWDDIQNEDLQTTPEFKSFLSKRLSKHLDSLITTAKEIQQRDTLPDENIGVKLLNSSSSFVDIKANANFQSERQKRQRMPSVSSSDSEEESNRLSEAAVSLDFIMSNASVLQGSSESDKRTSLDDKGNKAHNGESHVDRSNGMDNKKVKKSKKKRKKNISDDGVVKEDNSLLITNDLTLKKNGDQVKEIVIDKVEFEGNEIEREVGEVPALKRVKKRKKERKEQINNEKLDNENNRIGPPDCSIVKKDRTGKDMLHRNDNENLNNSDIEKVRKKKKRKKEELR